MLTTKQKLYTVIKRIIDVFGSLLGIILLFPLFILCAIITKLTSRGPVFFKQTRLGKYEKQFVLVKFRSMRQNAPQIPPENMSVEKQQSMVTGWGKFMRKTSLDELPQLGNIFVGNMSFIGPRPSLPENLEGELVRARRSYIPSPYAIKPGLSGYAQIHMKRQHNIDEKAREDSYYVKKMNLWFDTKIFAYSLLFAFGIMKGR
jgi:O-antigen biosynthesis protein WbqP